MEEARRELNERTLEPSGMVRINAPVFFGQRHVAPALPGLTERYPKLSIELTLTDDYIDPHREPADVIFRIGVLTDSAFHARVLASSAIILPRHRIISAGTACWDRPKSSPGINAWSTAVRQDQTNGCCAGTVRNGCTTLSHP